MSEIMHCLPSQDAKRHFIDLRNVRLEKEIAGRKERLAKLRGDLAARGQYGRSGWQAEQEWKISNEMADALATGYVDDALATCRLYGIEITKQLTQCLLTSVEEQLRIQYRHAVHALPEGHLFQQRISTHQHRVMPAIRVTVDTARIQDARGRAEKMKPKESTGNTHNYNQTITQHGGVMNASQTGNVAAQQITVQDMSELPSALATVRSYLRKQDDWVDADEHIGLLASAEKAAVQNDENKMLGFLKQIPAKLWDFAKPVATQGLLAYLHHKGFLLPPS